jgi:putative component of toxin-antitoxin plasmid stabilization module
MGDVILLLLCGGDKTTQQKDITYAKACLQDYKNRTQKSRGAGRRL